ncbi:Mg/Co/Ni transporter MgtE, CBS domain-containing [hydrothermal vent metagenome]|uniref:Mg/Co/Ni transporter MgtE, CBS domain-containing n=1 Tax=hydrothermal vent metagenome TaxID=652676 RepID=A0A3B1C2P4_9ZZZZ
MLENKKALGVLREIESGTVAGIPEKHHPADIALALDQVTDENLILKFFLALDHESASEILIHLNDHTRDLILEKSPAEKLGVLIEEMDSDDAADILADVDEERVEDIMETVSDDVDEEVSRLMEYDEDTAGGIMQTEFASIHGESTITETIEELRTKAEDIGEFHNVFVVDEQKRLLGTLPLHTLIINSGDTLIKDLLEGHDPISVTADTDQEEVAHIVKRYDLVSLPVVDEVGKLLGRIVVDDIVDVLEEEASEDIMKMAGTHDEALVQTHSSVEMAKYRFPWLASSLVAGFVAGSLIWQFKATLSEALALVAFIPVVMGISGNVGSQSSALVVRGMATGKIDPGSLGWYLVKELKIGLLLGVACGILAGSGAYFWLQNGNIGWIVGMSIFISIIAAAIMGAAIPLLFRWVKIDPAIAGGPIVLAMNDITGILIFFAIATALMGV